MQRPNGMTVVTAGMGALVLVHVVWSWGTRHAEAWSQPSVPAASAAFDVGTTFQLHSGAWRAWPAPAEEAPVAAPATLPAPETPSPMGVAPPAPEALAATPAEPLPPRDRKVPIQQITRHEAPSIPLPQANPASQAEPSASPADQAPAAPTPPPAEGRMALSGPDAGLASAATGHAGYPAPAARSAPSAPEPDTAPPSATKFGPAAFKLFERNGF